MFDKIREWISVWSNQGGRFDLRSDQLDRFDREKNHDQIKPVNLIHGSDWDHRFDLAVRVANNVGITVEEFIRGLA